MALPDVAYARSGDVSIAYQVVGEGPIDIVFIRASSGDLVSTWDQPLLVRHVEGLAQHGRVLMLDKRGTGLSDRVREVPSVETTMDDVRAVMDAAGSKRAVIWSGGQSTGIAVLFAATYPERCAGLMLFKPTVRGVRSTDYPWSPTREEWAEQLHEIRERWGERTYFERLAREWAPEVSDDPAFVEWFVWHMRRSLSPGAALTSFRTVMELDVADLLGAIRVPTLVLPHPADPGPGHYTAERIQGAETAELPELHGHYTWADDDAHEATMAATASFLSRLTSGPTERLLATILFTDIVESTQRTVELGDAAWKELLERHHALVRTELARFQGRELDTLETASSRRSKRRAGRSPAREQSAKRSGRSTSASALASMRVSSCSPTARSQASASRSAPASLRSPAPTRSSSRRRSRISLQAPGSPLTTVASTSSRASRGLAAVRGPRSKRAGVVDGLAMRGPQTRATLAGHVSRGGFRRTTVVFVPRSERAASWLSSAPRCSRAVSPRRPAREQAGAAPGSRSPTPTTART